MEENFLRGKFVKNNLFPLFHYKRYIETLLSFLFPKISVLNTLLCIFSFYVSSHKNIFLKNSHLNIKQVERDRMNMHS